MERFAHKFLVIGFVAILFGFLLAHLLLPDEEVSLTERRKLEQIPELSAKTVFEGTFFTDAEAYLLDQFPLRDAFRTSKALYAFHVMHRADNNGIYLHDGGVYKLEYPLNEQQVTYAAKLLESIAANMLTENNRAYYAIIPDKNFGTAAVNGYPSIHYPRMFSLIREYLKTSTEIDLTDCLNASDYYRTDPHWRQEAIFPVAERIASAMGVSIDGEQAYERQTFGDFYGAYYGQSALPVAPDKLVFLESAVTDACTVSSVETDAVTRVYTPEEYDGMDAYDVFLSGAAALLTIENPLAKTDRELIIFRDSFGSSLAPLLLSGYSRVTLVDLRYIASSQLERFITFGDQDVLFLYSTLILNSGGMLR